MADPTSQGYSSRHTRNLQSLSLADESDVYAGGPGKMALASVEEDHLETRLFTKPTHP